MSPPTMNSLFAAGRSAYAALAKLPPFCAGNVAEGARFSRDAQELCPPGPAGHDRIGGGDDCDLAYWALVRAGASLAASSPDELARPALPKGTGNTDRRAERTSLLGGRVL